MPSIRVRLTDSDQGQLLTHAVYLSGKFEPPALCSGLGRCGRCRMRVLESAPPPAPEDGRVFTPEELAQGWRLGCRHMASSGMLLALPAGSVPVYRDTLSGIVFHRGAGPKRPAPALKNLPSSSDDTLEHFQGLNPPELHADTLLAVDLGTTSLHWRISVQDGAVHPEDSGIMVNPQMGAGSDVISRLAVAERPGGAERLQFLALEALRRIARQSAAAGRPVSALCLAANPAMTCLALGRDASSLARAPYALPLTGGEWTSLPDLPPVWIPPQLSPFVGGDISAGYASLVFADKARDQPKYPFLLTDMGTNGEFLLALSPEEALVTSVPLGPALEGIGLPHGTEARPGAVTGFALTPQGLDMRFFEGREGPVAGISGSGYISLLHCLLKAGCLDREGHFRPSPLLERFFARLAESEGEHAGQQSPGEESLPLGRGLRLYAGDVEEFLKVKAAFSLGFSRLLAEAGLAARDLSEVVLAGALGEHADREALENLGFFPSGAASRLRSVGNASLAGAALLLRSKRAREALVRWAGGVRVVDMAGPSFQRDFAGHMRFTWQR